ncbi:NAD/NADP octopine/nopaline dehydrogenase family protein [Oscillibacter valericigenes]|uniref:NAD/NADP octopine/nopaline dehydrogenase family protein n=1 Tax=Oscillibacter valericigenes TaxID=351091 RepID=UPI0019579047|nr:NAD/NADP-dependent octopine/nopaline dehydrogenase family protein [Oscillibacter valericigenes]MBM6910881.1 NAD/NADP octopine/nopaline dehydrogenase family protein [Oscillibacter valericigenes]
MTNKPIAIVGGGNGGQAFAGWLSLRGFQTRLFDVVPSTCDTLNEKGGVEVMGNANYTGFGKIQFASTDMEKVLDGCELIMVILPSIYHKSMAQKMAPYLKDGQIVLLNPNASLGAVEFRKTLDDCGCKADILLGASATLLFACRAVEVGKVQVAGQKETLTCTALPSSRNGELKERIGDIFPAYNFDSDIIEVSLDNINAFVHPGPTLLNTGRIESGISFEYYLDFTPSQAALVEALDKERCAIAKAYGVNLPTIVEEYLDQYETKGNTIYEVLTNCEGYHGVMGPKSLEVRYLLEDIPYSLEAICAMADIAGVPTPTCHAVITLARAILGDKLDEGRTAKNLGIEGMTKEQFIKLCRG